MRQLLAAVGLTALLGATLAFAHPHETDTAPYKKIQKDDNLIELDTDDGARRSVKIIRKIKTSDDTDILSEELEQHFEAHSAEIKKKIERADKQRQRAVKKYSKSVDIDNLDVLNDPDSLRGLARSLETLLADSGVISNYTDIIVDIIEDVEIVDGDKGLSLNFDGKTLGRIQVDGIEDDIIGMEALGRNMTVEKEVITENGKTKTRIVIEMDGGEDIDIDVKSKSKSKPNSGMSRF